MDLPEPLLNYMSDTKPLQGMLRLSLIQLSAFALQQATTKHRFAVDFSSVEKAAQSYAGASEGLQALRVPNGARHYHSHLQQAASHIEAGLACTKSSADTNGDGLFHALKEADRHMRSASRCLPGAEMVDLTQSCCAAATTAPPHVTYAFELQDNQETIR